jgi:hypothetical protein
MVRGLLPTLLSREQGSNANVATTTTTDRHTCSTVGLRDRCDAGSAERAGTTPWFREGEGRKAELRTTLVSKGRGTSVGVWEESHKGQSQSTMPMPRTMSVRKCKRSIL